MRGRIFTLLLTAAMAACSGSNGSNGAAGLDTGSIAGTVMDGNGAVVAGASISTTPASTTATTDTSGNFTLASIPIGAYTVTASKTGYQNGQLSAVGVAAGATNQISLTLLAGPKIPGAIAGTVLGRQGVAKPSSPVAGASVCVENAAPAVCTSTASDGTFTLSGVSAGSVFLSATATGFEAGETKEAVAVAAGASSKGVSITLSGVPSASATYVGAAKCVTCHSAIESTSTIVTAWQGSAHAGTVDHTLNHVDLNGWPAAGASCTAPNSKNSMVQANDPVNSPVSGQAYYVWLVSWPANCPAQPQFGLPANTQFAMVFDINGNGMIINGSGMIAPGEIAMPVQGTQGGVATDAGQCGNGGLMPLAAYNPYPGTTGPAFRVPCAANYLSASNPQGSAGGQQHGYWQQEYLVNIGSQVGHEPSSCPTPLTAACWVTWNTSGTPQDMLALPLAWNQRGQYWANAPDYPLTTGPNNPMQGGTFAKVCAGCHETGPSLTTDANGNVTTYVAGSQNIACERCHGPGSDHVTTLDAKSIINPAYITAQAQNEMCGQCHTNLMSSAQPAGAFDFAWNNQAAAGGGNFIPGVHQLANFATFPAYGDPSAYWPGGVFPNLDHMTFVDVTVSAHNTNPYEKVTCTDCHESHSVVGGAAQIARTDTTGNQYLLQGNDAVLRNDVLCLACHATHEDFASVALQDVANYHLSQSTMAAPTSVQLNGTAYTPSTSEQSTSASLVADAVNAHMLSKAGMPAYFDPNATVNGQPVGRCSSCHMMKTAWTSNFLFSGPDATGTMTADLSGDVSAHTMLVAQPQDALSSTIGAMHWYEVMPTSCGNCHAEYRVGFQQ